MFNKPYQIYYDICQPCANILEDLVHSLLTLFETNETSSVTNEGTNNTRCETREESLNTTTSVDTLSTVHKALVHSL